MPSLDIKAIVLDLDNTVYRYDPCHKAGLEAARLVATRLHAAWDTPAKFHEAYRRARDEVKRHTGGQAAQHSRLLYFKRMSETGFGRSNLPATRALCSAYWADYYAAMRLEQKCAETLTRVRAAGLRIACVTNFTTDFQMVKLTTLGIDRHIDFLVASEEAGAEKPSEAPFRLALERLGVPPAEAVSIGDDLEADVRPARAMGMGTIWLRRDPQGAPPTETGPVADGWPAIQALILGERFKAA